MEILSFFSVVVTIVTCAWCTVYGASLLTREEIKEVVAQSALPPISVGALFFVWKIVLIYPFTNFVITAIPFEGYVWMHAIGAVVLTLASVVACALFLRATFEQPFKEAPVVTWLVLSIMGIAAGWTLYQVWLVASEMLDETFLFLGYTETLPQLFEKFILARRQLVGLKKGLGCIPFLAYGFCVMVIFIGAFFGKRIQRPGHV